MPAVTGVFQILTEAAFNEQAPDGGPLHFRDQYVNGQLVTYHVPNPTGAATDSGKTAREVILEQAATHGWPLLGIYVSGGGQMARHCCWHRSELPTNSPKKADRLQADVDAGLESLYKWEEVDDETGLPFDVRQFHVVTHFVNYRQDKLYQPGVDYMVYCGNEPPAGQWW